MALLEVSSVRMPPLAERLAVFALWATWVGIAFFGIYPTMNWLSGLREQTHAWFTSNELQLPFVPEFIWVYLSMYLLFVAPPFFLRPERLRQLGRELVTSTIIAGLVFLAFPAHLGFPRALPENEFYGHLFREMFSVDQPFNLVPSLHVVYSTAICLAIMESANKTLRAGLLLWLALLMASTVLVHQHHLVDVASGFLLALLVRYGWERKNA